jgi:hypothetical protein
VHPCGLWQAVPALKLEPALARPAALGTFCYSSATTGFRYCLTTVADSFAGAAGSCTQNASQLVSYTSFKEQQEVEQYFVDLGERSAWHPRQLAWLLGARPAWGG